MIPVVFIHKGNSAYIYNTLYQLKQTNPGVDIYFIGTQETRVYEPLVQHIPIEQYSAEADAFAEIYTHYSSNSAAFELICIQRWFVLNAFLKQKNIDRCLYLDSDVLIYADIQKLADTFIHAGMTLCGISGHTNFISSDVLTGFCQFVFDSYNGPEAQDALRSYYDAYIAQHGIGGISDMTFLTRYASENPGKVENTYYQDGRPTFDPSFEVGSAYFEMDGKFKKVTFTDSSPFGISKQTQEPVLFYSLHFQGGEAKKNMLSYIPHKSVGFWKGYIVYKSVYYLQKIRKKIRRQKTV